MLHDIQLRYNDTIFTEALNRFGFAADTMQPLEGSAFVYEGLLDGQPRILKIAPGLRDPEIEITGSSRDQLLAELDFVQYLTANGLPAALPTPSRCGEWVEMIPLDEHACFLAYAFEKAPGEMYPDGDEVHFPPGLIVEWGRISGQLHRLSAAYQPHPARRRLPWHASDLLDFRALIPASQPLVHQRQQEILQRLHSLPQGSEDFGLVHGDFHHGNFLADGEKITIIDFDGAEYYWYAGEVCVALHDSLPLPRSQTAKRRAYAVNFLRHFLAGYRQERPFSNFWLAQIPLFLKYIELLHYAYFHKYWDMAQLTEKRRAILAEYRQRIENETPVVAFEPDDWEQLSS